ncbi:MAG: helix-turn-helix transcriptional regulator [Dehalococcoidia bacterium]|nr:helix-turn-helix transcriptional regulator [Dehalococcoidia bacterium]
MNDVVNVVRALSADIRLRLLRLLRSGEMSAAEIEHTLGMPRQTLSYHLHVLEVGGLVTSRRDGRRLVYASSLPAVADSGGEFERFLTHALDEVR